MQRVVEQWCISMYIEVLETERPSLLVLELGNTSRLTG
jgi:hypothetical protein